MSEERAPTGIRMAREFVVIVLGVLSALAVDAAWQGVQERRQESEYLQALADDFAVNQERLAFATRRFEQMGTAAEQLLRVVQGLESPPRDSLIRLVRGMGGSFRFEPQEAALDDLTSTGGMRLLRDPELRRALSDFDGYVSQLRDRAEQFNDQWQAPPATDLLELIELYDNVHDPDAPNAIRADWDAIISTREFRNLATRRAQVGTGLAANHRRMMETVTRIQSLPPEPGTR